MFYFPVPFGYLEQVVEVWGEDMHLLRRWTQASVCGGMKFCSGHLTHELAKSIPHSYTLRLACKSCAIWISSGANPNLHPLELTKFAPLFQKNPTLINESFGICFSAKIFINFTQKIYSFQMYFYDNRLCNLIRAKYVSSARFHGSFSTDSSCSNLPVHRTSSIVFAEE